MIRDIEKMLRIKGEMNDEDYDYSDAYYGITLYGWELIKENVTTDFTEMINLGIISRVDEQGFGGENIYISKGFIKYAKLAELIGTDAFPVDEVDFDGEYAFAGEDIPANKPCVISNQDGKLYLLDETDAISTLDGER